MRYVLSLLLVVGLAASVAAANISRSRGSCIPRPQQPSPQPEFVQPPEQFEFPDSPENPEVVESEDGNLELTNILMVVAGIVGAFAGWRAEHTNAAEDEVEISGKTEVA